MCSVYITNVMSVDHDIYSEEQIKFIDSLQYFMNIKKWNWTIKSEAQPLCRFIVYFLGLLLFSTQQFSLYMWSNKILIELATIMGFKYWIFNSYKQLCTPV